MNLKFTIFFIFLLKGQTYLHAQMDVAFQHVNTQNGLSNNSVIMAMEDNLGYLWIATTEGLNGYDGRKMQSYFLEQNQQLGNNNIRDLIADNQNRLWIRSFGGFISVLNKQGQFKAVNIKHADTVVPIYNMVKTRSRGIVLFRAGLHFLASDTTNLIYKHWNFPGDSLFNIRLTHHLQLDEDRVVFIGTNRLFIMDYRQGKIILNLHIPNVLSAAPLSNNKLLLIIKNKGLFRLQINKAVLEKINGLKDQAGWPLPNNLNIIRKMADGRYIIASYYKGIFLLDEKTGSVKSYQHDPLNSQSLIGGTINQITCYPSGQVYIASSSGLCFFNVFNKQASYQPYFIIPPNNNIFDGYVTAILPHKKEEYWVAVFNQLLLWNKQTGKSTAFEFGRMPNGETARGLSEVSKLCFDDKGRIWVGTNGNGLCVLNKDGRMLKQWIFDSTAQSPLPANNIQALVFYNQEIWVASEKGICRFSTKTLQPLWLEGHPQLKPLQALETSAIWLSSKNELWIGERHGSWRYSFKHKSLTQTTRQKGSYSLYVACFNEDTIGNIYIGDRYGLTVMQGDSVMYQYTRGKGLRADRVQNILRDEKGNLWIDNYRWIVRYSPKKQHFSYFNEKSGLSPHGFRVGAAIKNNQGFLYFGSEKGLNWFHPDSLFPPVPLLKSRVQSVKIGDSNYVFPLPKIPEISPSGNFSIQLSTISLNNPSNIQFRHQLLGHNEQPVYQQNIETIQYSRIRPGIYTFTASASEDGQNWVPLGKPILFIVQTGFFHSWQFRVIAAFFLALAIFLIFKRREYLIHKHARKKASEALQRAIDLQYQLESEQVISYFATSLNSSHTVNDVLWDVAKNCISKLDFQDCVIYGWDPEKQLLIQKAAYGPKNIDYREIFNPIEIVMGTGIVGSVALSRKPALIANTSNDNRYIVDDAIRLSEIAVPIMSGERLWGVLDSEHPQPGFYTTRHLQILTAIATLVANKLEQVSAEQAIRQKEIEMARLQRDMATSQLTSTRAQMNPHFIFNALNSIQQFVLQGNTDEANRYLSQFSRLLREILNHCNQPFISLKKEMEMLTIYLQLEQLRFNGSFEFNIKTELELDEEETLLPPMILQPFVENSIWHGLMPQKGQRQVSIQFKLQLENQLACIIEDNGIGRNAAATLKAEQLKPKSENHESKGLNLVNERLELLKQQFLQPFSARIEDLIDHNGTPIGTRVTVLLFIGH